MLKTCRKLEGGGEVRTDRINIFKLAKQGRRNPGTATVLGLFALPPGPQFCQILPNEGWRASSHILTYFRDDVHVNPFFPITYSAGRFLST